MYRGWMDMKYELKRDFYYTVYKTSQPRYYNTKIDMFDDLISLRDFVNNTYRNGYTIEEVGMDFKIQNDTSKIWCEVRQIG